MATTTYPTTVMSEKTIQQSRQSTDVYCNKTDKSNESRRTSMIPRLPARPPPTLQRDAHRSSNRSSAMMPHDSANTLVPGEATRPLKGSSPSSSPSSSSFSNSSTMTPMSSIELEKSILATKGSGRKPYSSTPPRRSRDVEKGDHDAAYFNHRRTRPHAHCVFTSAARPSYVVTADADDEHRMYEANAVRILLFLALPCVVLSLLNAFWTLLSLLITTLTQPVRLCARRPTFGQQLGGLVGPALNLQLRGIGTPLPPHADEDAAYRPGALVAVQVLSPFLSFGVMLAAWVVAVFWLTSAMIGDPAGLDRRDDGRDTVLGLRRWWERWLTRSMVDE